MIYSTEVPSDGGRAAVVPRAADGDAVAWVRGCPAWMGWAALVAVAVGAHGWGLRFSGSEVAAGLSVWSLWLHVLNVLWLRAGGAVLLRAAWPNLGRASAQRAAWCAAALLACHPLVAGGLNLAPDLPVLGAALLTQLAVGGVAAFALTRWPGWLVAPGAAVVLTAATGSLGFAQAALSAGLAAGLLLVLRMSLSDFRSWWRREYRLILIGLLASAALLGPTLEKTLIAVASGAGPETLVAGGARFWQAASTLVWPVAAPEAMAATGSTAWLAQGSWLPPAAALGLAAGLLCGLGWRRTRGVSLLLTLGLLPLVGGLLPADGGTVPAAHLYAALPWFCLLLGWGLGHLWSWRPPVLLIAMAVLISAGATGSARRATALPAGPAAPPHPAEEAATATTLAARTPGASH